MKIAINVRFGGFGLSPLAAKRYAELKGKECYFFSLDYAVSGDRYRPITIDEANTAPLWLAYSVPNPQDYRLGKRDADGLFRSANKRAEEIKIDHAPADRSDPDLIQVIEELGDRANTKYSTLKIIEIPDDVEWEIEEYDGTEWVSEKHRRWE